MLLCFPSSPMSPASSRKWPINIYPSVDHLPAKLVKAFFGRPASRMQLVPCPSYFITSVTLNCGASDGVNVEFVALIMIASTIADWVATKFPIYSQSLLPDLSNYPQGQPNTTEVFLSLNELFPDHRLPSKPASTAPPELHPPV